MWPSVSLFRERVSLQKQVGGDANFPAEMYIVVAQGRARFDRIEASAALAVLACSGPGC